MRKNRLIPALLLALAASGSTWAQQPVADKKLIKAHLSFLADDLLEGRATGTRGYDIAANYVTSQFMQYGLAPRGDQGSYLQRVPFGVSHLVPGSARLEITGKAGSETLAFGDEYIMRGSLLEDQSDTSAPLVFAGYGIQSDRFKHDDYAALDVKGKIVVVLHGSPSSFPTEEGAHFGGLDTKMAFAARHGAAGILVLYTPRREKVQPFAKLKQYAAHDVMGWQDGSGKVPAALPAMQNVAYLSIPASHKLFVQAGVKLDDIYALALAGKPLPRMDLGLSARLAKKSVRSQVGSSNVIGMIEGSDPQLKNEYLVFTAHLDHVGVEKEKTGDNIFNGAMDNASGVATLLETARLFGQSKVKPKRSILFIALTAEEKGLLGSDYFANNPTVPATSIVANVNLDMPLLTFDFKNVMAFGAEHSSLKGTTTRALKKMNIDLIPDPWPDQGLFTRSDHYMFVRKGIPSIFLATGMASSRKDEDAAKLWGEFLQKHYHQPSDDLNLPINYDAAARFAQINYNIALEIANTKEKPSWNKGDFFGDTFKQ